MLRALVYIVPVALAVYALIDLSRSREAERSGLPTLAWVAIIVLVPVLGPIIWLVLSRRTIAGSRPAPAPGSRPGPAPRRPGRTGPVAPDDDPDFLWRLEQEQRRRRRATGGGTQRPGTPAGSSGDERADDAPPGATGPAPQDEAGDGVDEGPEDGTGRTT